MTVPFGFDSELNDWILATGDPTGFSDPTNVIVTYDSTARTITLTGTVKAYYRGRIVPELVSGWVSAAHSATTGAQYFLYYNGTAFVWATSPWTFPQLQIAFVNYGATNKFALRECHGLMPWAAHEEFHQTIGTYRTSGGVVGDYTLASTTAAQRRPTVTAAVIHDEDCITTLAALATGSYTLATLTGAAVTTFTLSAAEIVPVLSNNPYYNLFSTPNWTQVLMANTSYMSVWLLALPVTADATSQAYRYLWMQGQTNGTLASQNALTPGDLNLGSLATIATEFVFIAKVVLRYSGTNWELTSVTSLAGNKFFQTAALSTPVAWGGITGTLSNQADLQAALDLKANLTANTFTANQTINTNGTPMLLSSYSGANSVGRNSWIGGGGQSSVGQVGATYKGGSNSSLGIDALLANTEGYGNLAIGYAALKANTSGYSNAAIGSNVMEFNTVGYSNVAIGQLALRANVNGWHNVAIGESSMVANVDGAGNIAVGIQTLMTNVSGLYNTAIGRNALQFNTASNNTAIGASALLNTTTGRDNTAVGFNALTANIGANYNTAVGSEALKSNTTGINNTAVGNGGLYTSNGDNNTAIGWNTLVSNATGNRNTAIGQAAFYSLNNSGGVAIGAGAGFYETAANKLFIDNATRANEADGRAKALIYGVFNATVANQELTFNTGKMGFFGTAAQAKPTGVAVTAAAIHSALVSLGLIAA